MEMGLILIIKLADFLFLTAAILYLSYVVVLSAVMTFDKDIEEEQDKQFFILQLHLVKYALLIVGINYIYFYIIK